METNKSLYLVYFFNNNMPEQIFANDLNDAWATAEEEWGDDVKDVCKLKYQTEI